MSHLLDRFMACDRSILGTTIWTVFFAIAPGVTRREHRTTDR